jgi:membrane-bound inhibitor of C-type lysozyme
VNIVKSLPKLLAAALAGFGIQAAVVMPLTVPQIQSDTTQAVRYVCTGGSRLSVVYMNAKNGQSFAALAVEGKRLLFVNVISGSGARYVASHYTWWTKGPEGTLTDDMKGPDAPPVLGGCKARG